MAVKLQSLIASVTGSPSVAPGELQRATDSFIASLRRAGADRARLLAAVDDLEHVERLLRARATEQRHTAGRTHAVEVAEEATAMAAGLRFAARPAGRYLPSEYLAEQLWRVARRIERARIALQWARPDGIL
jgi:hypothetical protein